MEKIKGIGAVMIYANQPAELAQWYFAQLGIETSLNDEDGFYYGDIKDQASGYTVHFGIFAAEKKLAEDNHALMVNYRIDNLDEFLSQLKTDGIVIEKTLNTDYGRFAYIRDPEGNPIELYEESSKPEDN
jgi:predicted enzyme related to lactoylglutathione lyase